MTAQECEDIEGAYEGDQSLCSDYQIELPDVVGLSEEEATDILSNSCLEVVTECAIPETPIPMGEVLNQSPSAGTPVTDGKTVYLGVSTGFAVEPFPIEGSGTGAFLNPQGPSGMVTTGTGTDIFSWGIPFTANHISSSLSFVGNNFDTETETEFIIGTLSYTNGTIVGYTDADTVALNIDIIFETPTGVSRSFVYQLELVDTPNVGTPDNQADFIRLSRFNSPAVFTVDGVTYTLKVTFGDLTSETGGFTEKREFFVYEGQSASAELKGKITACSDLPPTGACILSDDTCIQTSELDCMNVGDGGSEYLGDNTQCPPTGACIMQDGCCTEGTEQFCLDSYGEYQGDNTQCENQLIEVPDVVGLNETDAISAIEALCLEVETECAISDIENPAGVVINQYPESGTPIADGTTVILGVSNGVVTSPASIEGGGSGTFINPTGTSTMVTSGEGTSEFAWGTPSIFGNAPSSLIFNGADFGTLSEQEFLLGTLSFYNGTIYMATDADTVDLEINVDLSSGGGISQKFVYQLELIDTPGTINTPPEIQADIVKITDISTQSIFYMDGVACTLKLTFGDVYNEEVGFSERDQFFVFEGESSTVELRGKITACVDVEPLVPINDLYARAKSGKINIVWAPIDEAVSYNIYRSTTSGGPYTLIAEEHVTDYAVYADFGLTNGTTYYYVVRWINDMGQESPDSNEASATPSERQRR
jgi:hypothetical protein